MMLIKARFASRCPACGCEIRVGDSVVWERGQKAAHEKCPTLNAFLASWKVEHPRGSIEVLGDRDGWFFFRSRTSKGRASVFAVNLASGERLYLRRRAEIVAEIAALEPRRRPGERWDVVGGSIFSLRCELDKYVIFDGLEVDEK